MGILMDLIIIAIVILSVFFGYKKGLINVIFSLVAFLIAIVISLFLFRPISNLVIEKTEIDEKIKEVIINNVSKEEEDGENIEENIETKENNSLKNYVESKMKEQTDTAKNETIDVVAESIAIRSIEILTGIGLFIVIRLILFILKFLTHIIEKLPVIKQFNEVGGIIYGILRAAIIILLLLMILYFAVSVKPGGTIDTSIKDSYITKFLYENINMIINYCLLCKNLL